mmetsp:Transcript_56022/g.103664  ORF Transcript_56022/g.103664 Transcript_56022/m.103664 type:complete len:91 (+) Transcript_56022:39-311(+)
MRSQLPHGHGSGAADAQNKICSAHAELAALGPLAIKRQERLSAPSAAATTKRSPSLLLFALSIPYDVCNLRTPSLSCRVVWIDDSYLIAI